MTTTQLTPTREPTEERGWRRTLRARPLLSFFLLANLASWAAWTPYVLSRNGLGVWDFTFPGGEGFSQLTGVLPGAYLGPIGSAVLITAVTQGRAGLRTWLGRMLRWRVGWRWYAGTLLGVPLTMVLATTLLGGSPTVPPAWVLVALVPGLVLQALTTGLAEEPGWRDFALPRLQDRFGPLGAAAVLGPVWGVWHLPLFLTDWAGGDAGWVDVAVFLAFTCCFNVVMTWVFNRTGQSVPLAMLLHVSVNNTASIAWSEVFPDLGGADLQRALLVASAVAAAVLLVATRGRLGYAGPVRE